MLLQIAVRAVRLANVRSVVEAERSAVLEQRGWWLRGKVQLREPRRGQPASQRAQMHLREGASLQVQQRMPDWIQAQRPAYQSRQA